MPEEFKTIHCWKCGGSIEFSIRAEGQIISCPHCQQSLLLQVPKIKQHPPRLKIALYFAIAVLLIIVVVSSITLIKRNQESKLQVAEQQARYRAAVQQAYQAIAALKVCTEGTTYDEFRQRELELETAYEINKPSLSKFDMDIQQLIALDKACDLCWSKSINYGGEEDIISPNWPGCLDAMKLIHPEITNKLDLPVDQWDKVPDFYGKNYIKWGLTKINLQCEALLFAMQNQLK